MSYRKNAADALKRAAVMHWVKLRYGVFLELGLNRKARLRADIVCVNYRRHVIVVEVKSSLADFNADTKWTGYLNHCDQYYWLVPQPLWDSGKLPKPSRGAGVMVLDSTTGHLRCVVKARVQKFMDEDERY